MNILVVCQYYYPEPFRIHEICEGLVKMGHGVTVATSFPNYPDGEIYEGYESRNDKTEMINGVEVIRYRIVPRHKGVKYLALNYLSYAIKAAYKIVNLKKRAFDVIYVYQLSPVTMAIPAIRYKKRYSIPLYLYCLDIWPESIKEFIPNENSLSYRIISYFSSEIYKKADMIGVTSSTFEDYLAKICGVDKKSISYLPQHAEDIGECIKISNSSVELYFTGNIGEAQNVDLIIDAVYKIKDIGEFTINFVGSGSKLEYAIQKVENLGLANKIIFHGRHPASEMPGYYKKADACLLTLSNQTSAGMTIPGKLQGYMAAGKTIIASINGDAARIIKESLCGIVVPADDVDAFADALKHYIKNQTNYSDCGKNARKYYEDHFTLERYLDQLIHSFRVLIDERKSLINKRKI